MRCPIDKSDMIVVEHKKIELDYCLRCSGVWLDAGELELLVSVLCMPGDTQPAGGLLKLSEARVREVKRRCPICGRAMHKGWLGEQPKILIDNCPSGHGMWFDGGELQQVLQQAAPAGSNDVISFLGDAFPIGNKPVENPPAV
jgi:uncharacterized protein